MTISRLALALVLWLGLPAPAQAQFLPRLPLSLEARIGGGLPTGEFAERQPGVGAELGLRIEGGGVLHLLPWLGIFGGASWAEFSCPACREVGLTGDLVETGGGAGLHLTPPVQLGGLEPWIRAGALFQQLEFVGPDESLITPVGTGFQLGGGVSIPIRGGLALTPGLQFRYYPAELELGGTSDRTFDRTLDVSHLTLDVGVSFHF